MRTVSIRDNTCCVQRRDGNVRNFLPDTLDVADFGLTTQLSFGTDFTRDLLDFRGEDGQLVNHAVDGVDEIEDLSRDRHARDLLRQVSLGDSTLDARTQMMLGLSLPGDKAYRSQGDRPHL